ncbi:hypothetical protein OG571_47255 (plasmid) [Streptomyces sp. NBC_01369]|uniref:hypothetical protein n=1 Tax=Streptomyces sp. NBC_01369 TaxID=2903842 RepID=UPI002F9104D3
MTTQWNAGTAETAPNLLDAARQRIEAALKVAHPGDNLSRHKAAKTAPVHLSISLDTTALEQLGTELHAFNAQVNGGEQA